MKLKGTNTDAVKEFRFMAVSCVLEKIEPTGEALITFMDFTTSLQVPHCFCLVFLFFLFVFCLQFGKKGTSKKQPFVMSHRAQYQGNKRHKKCYCWFFAVFVFEGGKKQKVNYKPDKQP